MKAGRLLLVSGSADLSDIGMFLLKERRGELARLGGLDDQLLPLECIPAFLPCWQIWAWFPASPNILTKGKKGNGIGKVCSAWDYCALRDLLCSSNIDIV